MEGVVSGWFCFHRRDTKAASGGFLLKKLLLEISQNWQENTCDRVSLLIKKRLYLRRDFIKNFIKKEFLLQVFSGEFYEVSKNTFCTEHLWTTASGDIWISNLMCFSLLLRLHVKEILTFKWKKWYFLKNEISFILLRKLHTVRPFWTKYKR